MLASIYYEKPSSARLAAASQKPPGEINGYNSNYFNKS